MNIQHELTLRAVPAAAGPRLFGRDAEVALMQRVVDRLPERGGALVIRGEPGIGKTALLAVAEARARSCGVRVLNATGIQSEADLAFSGLHQLLLPILHRRDGLLAGQADALAAAFGLLDVPVTDPYLVALATLGLLADASELTPLLVLCEDAQWLDLPTVVALSFIARRVDSEPIAVIVATRDGHPGPLDTAGLPEVRLPPLDELAAQRLLDEHRPVLSLRARRRILRAAQGNPLALIELPGEPVSIEHQGKWEPLDHTPSLTSRLERAFAWQQSQLPADTRAALLVAATDQEVVLPEVLAAASLILHSKVGEADLAPALSCGLATVDDGRFSFRHPLIRSAIYHSASANERRAAHAALAATISGQLDRRTWHRAAACVGPDHRVAAELEQLASRLARRGATTVAATALARSAELTSAAHSRVERLLRAAELEFELGRAAAVEQLVVTAERDDPDPRQRARIAWLRDIFTDGVPGDPAPVLALTAAAEQCCASGDVELALKLLLGAGLRSWWKDPGESVRDRVVAVADGVPTSPLDPRMIAIVAVCAPVARGSETVERLGQLRLSPDEPQAAYLAGMAAHAVGHYELAARFFDIAKTGLRTHGRLALLCQVRTMEAWDLILIGDWVGAATAAEEAHALASETDQPIWLAGARLARAVLAGVQGDVDTTERLVTEAEATTIRQGLSALQCCGALARGIAALGEGRHEDAFEHMRRMFDPGDPAFHRADRFMGIGYLADAALHGGRCALARDQLREFEELARVTRSPALRLGIVYSQAVLAED
ncbi:MAG: AAA family ATPase, partial [Solirubrobacterales bacterium]|nr:AAA family ATPase [Solirubrobacterales bacterium]